jgi:hypothetical protein
MCGENLTHTTHTVLTPLKKKGDQKRVLPALGNLAKDFFVAFAFSEHRNFHFEK